MYGTGNYADTSKRIGDSVEEAIGQNRARVDRIRGQEDRMRKQKLEDYAFEQLKVQEYSGLYLPQDSEHLDLENSFQKAANYIPDAFAALEDKNNGLSREEIAQGKALLFQDVGALKATRSKILQQINTGQTALESGTVSGYNQADTLDFYNGLLTPSSGYSTVMEKGQLVLKGTTPVEGKDVSIPLREYGRRAPELNVKGPDPLSTINVANKAAYDRGYFVTDSGTRTISGEYNNSIKDAFDSYLDSLPNQKNAIKSAAVDYLGFESEQVDKLADTRNNDNGGYTGENGEKYANALEYEMEKAFLNKATDGFLNSDKERISQEINQANKKSANIRLNQAVNNGKTNIDANQYKDLFNSIYNPKGGVGMNMGANTIEFGTGDVVEQGLLPGVARNVSEEMQSAISGLGFGNLGRFVELDEDGEFEGYEIPSKKKGGKPVFISKNESDPDVLFKGFLQASGLSTSQANSVFDSFFKPELLRKQYGY